VDTVTILAGIWHQTSTPDITSYSTETRHKPIYIVSHRAKYLVDLKVTSSARRPLSTVKAFLVESWTLFIKLAITHP